MCQTSRLIAVAALTGLLLCAGCTSTNQTPASQDLSNFIAAANDCRDMNQTVTNGVGTFTYTSTSGCVFIKTLDHLNATESRGMKNMLEGKNMTCSYTKGAFDSRLATSLVGGMEYCNGDLKDSLAELMIFTSP